MALCQNANILHPLFKWVNDDETLGSAALCQYHGIYGLNVVLIYIYIYLFYFSWVKPVRPTWVIILVLCQLNCQTIFIRMDWLKTSKFSEYFHLGFSQDEHCC